VKAKIAVLFCVSLLSACSVGAQTPPAANEKSCLQFTQDFYSWYVKLVFKSFDDKKARDVVLTALTYNGRHFSHELTLELRQAKAEEAASRDVILDGDPFLNSQDPAERYVVRKVTEKNGRYFADVYGIWPVPPAELGKGPQVVAELIFKDGRWIFVNFQYPHTGPGADDLLNLLNNQHPGTQPKRKAVATLMSCGGRV
jgi:hypothetical protein